MDDKPKRVWVRLVGAAALLAIVAGSVAIVGRRVPQSRQSVIQPDETEESPPDPTEAPIDELSRRVANLQSCITSDSALTDRKPGRRLGRLLRTPNGSGVQTPAYDDLIEVASGIEQLRHLRFTEPVRTRFVSADRLPKLLGRRISRKQAALDDLVLRALGVLPPGAHVADLSGELVTDQVAGFYRTRADEMVVPAPGRGQGLSPVDKSVLAHELEHALVDQRLGLGHLARLRPKDRDGALAALAVIEGSASLAGYRWTVSGLSLLDQLTLSSDPRVAGAGGVPAAIPHYLMRQFTFPYIEGLQFVCKLYEKGGWELVNRAIIDPPSTTLEILTPRLLDSAYKPPQIKQPRFRRAGWIHRFETTFGAANWVWLLEAPGGIPGFEPERAKRLARQWATGRLHVWTKRNNTAVALIGQTTGDDLCVSVLHWYDQLFDDDSRISAGLGLRAQWLGDIQSAAVACLPNQIRFGIAPTAQTASELVR